jgi:hypothetical protein
LFSYCKAIKKVGYQRANVTRFQIHNMVRGANMFLTYAHSIVAHT